MQIYHRNAEHIGGRSFPGLLLVVKHGNSLDRQVVGVSNPHHCSEEHWDHVGGRDSLEQQVRQAS